MFAVWGTDGFVEGLLVDSGLRELGTQRCSCRGTCGQASVEGRVGLCAASSLLRVRRGPVLRAHTLRSCLSWERDSHGQTGEVERYVPALLLLIVPFLLCLDPFFPEPSQATLTSCGAHCMTTLATITSPR